MPPPVLLPCPVTHGECVYFVLGSLKLGLFFLNLLVPRVDFICSTAHVSGHQAQEKTIDKGFRLRCRNMRVCKDGIGLIRPGGNVAVVASASRAGRNACRFAALP